LKKILYIVPHRPNRSPGQRFRCEQFFGFLEQNNYKITYSYIISEKDDKIFYSTGRYFTKFLILLKSIIIRTRDVWRASDYDIILIYRESFMLGTSIFEYLFSLSRTRIVFDFDDAIWLNDVSRGNYGLKWLKNPSKTSGIIKISDLVFAGNKYLYDYAVIFNENVKIIPTTIDFTYHIKVPVLKSNDSVCIGWIGSLTTIKHFEFAVPFLKVLKNKYRSKIYFMVIVDFPFRSEELELEATIWSPEKEIEYLSEFDIGIMPLPEDDFTKGKCGFKGLQCMSMEIPTVMSPVGVNSEIIKDGENGFLAANESEWIDKISILIDDINMRRKLGINGRQTVIEKYSMDSHKYDYVKYLDELIQQGF
jgi:glycosyltransferase involved in cell wall biosynthesis